MSRTTCSPACSCGCDAQTFPSISALKPLLLSLTFALWSALGWRLTSILCWLLGFTPPRPSSFSFPF